MLYILIWLTIILTAVFIFFHFVSDFDAIPGLIASATLLAIVLCLYTAVTLYIRRILKDQQSIVHHAVIHLGG